MNRLHDTITRFTVETEAPGFWASLEALGLKYQSAEPEPEVLHPDVVAEILADINPAEEWN